jgi:putative peptidoglycan lipid II flippase
VLKLVLAVCVMAAAIGVAGGGAEYWLHAHASERVVRLAGIVVLGAASYFATLWIVGFRLRDFSQRAAE